MVTTIDVNNPEAEGSYLHHARGVKLLVSMLLQWLSAPLREIYNVADGGVVPASGCLCCKKPEHKRHEGWLSCDDPGATRFLR